MTKLYRIWCDDGCIHQDFGKLYTLEHAQRVKASWARAFPNARFYIRAAGAGAVAVGQ